MGCFGQATLDRSGPLLTSGGLQGVEEQIPIRVSGGGNLVFVRQNAVRIMIQLRNLLFPVLLTLAACGGTKDSPGTSGTADGGPMAGNWTQVTGTDKTGMTITFDGMSDKISVHLAPGADDIHGHADGKLTYLFDDKTKALTVNAELMGHGKADTWTGTVAGETFELAAADTKLMFKKGGEPSGH